MTSLCMPCSWARMHLRQCAQAVQQRTAAAVPTCSSVLASHSPHSTTGSLRALSTLARSHARQHSIAARSQTQSRTKKNEFARLDRSFSNSASATAAAVQAKSEAEQQVASKSNAATTEPFESNVPASLRACIGNNLHLQKGHPLHLLHERISQYFASQHRLPSGEPEFTIYDKLSPFVTTQQCFDDLLIPSDHPSRGLGDTFYQTPDIVLRTHTSAHQTQFLRAAQIDAEHPTSAFLVVGDCYRRDEIDRTHYPVFHQIEGVKIHHSPVGERDEEQTQRIVDDLKRTLEGLVDHLFGKCDKRWLPDSFPFTTPSLQMEIFYQGAWLEILGCGVVQQRILEQCGKSDCRGWAFGMGLERLAMILFNIPDIRLFRSKDPRFLNQFKRVKAHNPSTFVKFEPWSKYPSCSKDVSFWLNPEQVPLWNDNDISAIVRECGGDLIESLECRDTFVHPKTKRTSKMYRILYCSLERNLTNVEVDEIQLKIREELQNKLKVELR